MKMSAACSPPQLWVASIRGSNFTDILLRRSRPRGDQRAASNEGKRRLPRTRDQQRNLLLLEVEECRMEAADIRRPRELVTALQAEDGLSERRAFQP